MNIYCFTIILSFIPNTNAYIEITGELTFDVRPINANGGNNARVKDDADIAVRNKILSRGDVGNSFKTTANIYVDIPKTTKVKAVNAVTNEDDCIYKYPDRKQVEALLSDMMNQLTKIFIRAYDYIGVRDRRRSGKRFKIIKKKFDTSFFEKAYNFMEQEYRKSINKTATATRLSSHDPCHHQSDLKQMWNDLLNHCKTILKRAAVRCISDLLRVRQRADDTRTKEKLGQLLLKEIKEVRSNQLKVLCDEFNLCYKDLLQVK